ncbi:histidine kinase [bacterium]|nr:histidine kinase [bacterium]
MKNKHTSIFCGAVFIPLIILLHSMSSLLTAQEIKFRHLSIEDGLSQSVVNCILQDRKGFLWIGTQDGLNRFDGYNFMTFRHDPQDSTSISSSWVQCLFEDRFGRIWAGTAGGGLNLYDAKTKTFRSFKNDPKDSLSLSSNIVVAIYEDRFGGLWVGTIGGGLNLYDTTSKTFRAFKNDPKDYSSLSSNSVQSIYEDRSGRLWIGTYDGLNLYDGKAKSFRVFTNNPKDPSSLPGNRVRSIYEDLSGRLWVGTTSGLGLYDTKLNTFQTFTNDPKDTLSLSSNIVLVVYEDHTGQLWVGTGGGGLNLFDATSKTFRAVKNSPNDASSLSGNHVLSMYEDRSGSLWVGTQGRGLNLYEAQAKAFRCFNNDPQNPSSLSDNVVWSICEDHSGRLWVGTQSGGLNLYDAKTKTFSTFKNDPKDPSSLSFDFVRSIYEDHSGRIWAGTGGGGLNLFDEKTKSFTSFKNDPKDSSSLSSNRVTSIYEDRSGRLWVSAFQGGLNLYDAKTKTFTSFRSEPENPTSISSDLATCIFQDRSGRLWVGTQGGGLNFFDEKTKTFTSFRYNSKDSSSLSSDFVNSIYEDHSGRLWVGTSGGLNLYDAETKSFRAIREKHGLPNDVVSGILEDGNGRLWISTNRGISRYDTKNETFRNYDITDGLQSNEFNTRAYFKGKDGRMYFGGINGFNVFHPDSINDDQYVPPIVLTGIEIFNKPIRPGQAFEGFVLHEAITESEELVLSFRESVFTLEFSALSYTLAEKNKYAYRLDGFDKDWNFTDAKRRFATYTNLDPGTYYFRVKGSNHDGIWNEEGRTLRIIITPPWWKTWWANTVYLLVLFGFVMGIIRFQVNKTKARVRSIVEKQKEVARIKEAELRAQAAEAQARSQFNEVQNAKQIALINKMLEQKKQQLEDLNTQKNEYLGIVAHDLRNPLSTIINYTELVMNDLQSGNVETADLLKDLAGVNNIAKNMSVFIAELLNIAAIESGNVQLEKQPEKIAEIIHDIFPLHYRRAEQKNIQVTLESMESLPMVLVDRSKIASVADNIISNAIKYTHPGGSVRIFGEKIDAEIHVHVADTGQGLTALDLQRVFTTFTKLSSKPTAGESSTGLGLSIVKKIIEIHGGRVWVKSEPGKGSTFSFSLPIP